MKAGAAISAVGRRALLLGSVAAAVGAPRSARADDEGTPPPDLQVELLSKVVLYDRTFKSRVGNRSTALVLMRGADVASVTAAEQFASALRRAPQLGGITHEIIMSKYENADQLAGEIRRTQSTTLYIAPALDGELESITSAAGERPLLTVAASADYVRRGVILGLRLVSSKPKLFIHLPQARKRQLDFMSDLLHLATVIS